MDPWDFAEISVREFLEVAELGTESNPILIRDDSAPLGSASNPIVIHIDDNWCHNDTDQLGSGDDTDIMGTPEFWAATQEIPNDADKCAVKEPSHGSCGRGSTKCKFSDSDGVSPEPRQFERLTKGPENDSNVDSSCVDSFRFMYLAKLVSKVLFIVSLF